MPDRSISTPFGRNVALARLLLDTLSGLGCTRAVICPGSRSTPVAVAADGSGIDLSIGLDERAAAFYALGLAKRSGDPVLLVTTSGTAAIEALPAVAEAAASGIPLVVLTADRPLALQGTGAAQTLDQVTPYGAFAPTVRLELAGASAEDVVQAGLRIVSLALGLPSGPQPVQVNLHVAEPLVAREVVELPPPARLRRPPAPGIAPLPAAEAVRWFDPGRRGWLVAGGELAGGLGSLGRLSSSLGWPLIADARAGAVGGYLVSHFDPILAAATGPALLPEVVVVAGEVPASRPLASWLRRCRETGGEILQLVERGGYRDPLALATQFAYAGIEATVSAFAPAGSRPEPLLATLDREVAVWLEGELAGYSEPGLARHLAGSLREGELLFVSSSMPIRYLDSFGGRGPARVLANRGVNGIDGVVSTFLGAAAANPSPSVLITGDLTFLYDAAALMQLPLPQRAAILVLDNRGGIIFDRVAPAAIVPGPVNERLFVTPHRSDIPALVAAAGIDLVPVTSAAGVDALLAAARGGGFAVGVATFDREATGTALDRLYRGAGEVVRRFEAR